LTSRDVSGVAHRWRDAFDARDLAALGTLLDANVRWGPAEETPRPATRVRRFWTDWPSKLPMASKRESSTRSLAPTRFWSSWT
jgi:hypothetical protein